MPIPRIYTTTVLCCLHPMATCDFHQVVGPPPWKPAYATSSLAIGSTTFVPCPKGASHLSLTILWAMSRFSLFLIWSRRETPSIALPIARYVTLNLLIRPIRNDHVSVAYVITGKHCGILDEKIFRSLPKNAAPQPSCIRRLTSFFKLDLPLVRSKVLSFQNLSTTSRSESSTFRRVDVRLVS